MKTHSETANQLDSRDTGVYESDIPEEQIGSGETISKFNFSLLCPLTNSFSLIVAFVYF